jgi:D-alanyl-D-alanine carboxypeptidase (penicillin-binding protein 5/6)
MMKKILCVILFAVLLFTTVSSISAGADFIVPYESPTYDTREEKIEEVSQEQTQIQLGSVKSAILMEPLTGTILYELDADTHRAPASITKIMTVLLVMEALEEQKIKIDDVFTCSEYAATMGGSQIWMEPGEEMTVDELLKSVMVGSANDAAVVLGEGIAGTNEAFVAKMNERAQQLGMTGTVFKNTTGLDEEGHYTTARDIAVMSRELLRHREILEYTTIWMDTVRGGIFGLSNTNRLIRTFSGANGLKTGSTGDAGFCISASAARDGMELIAVVLAADSSADRFDAAATLLNYGFANYSVKRFENFEGITKIPVRGGEEEAILPVPDGVMDILVPKGSEGKVETIINTEQSLRAPIFAGQKVGEVRFILDGQEVGTVDLISSGEIRRLAYFGILTRMWRGMFMNMDVR